DPATMAGVDGVPQFDQRGAPFVRVFDGESPRDVVIDIGAFELQPMPAAFFGDYNQDGNVDAADYVVWRNLLGASGVLAYSGADGNGDGVVDDEDYGVWRANFGRTVEAGGMELGAGSGNAMAVAEPVAQSDAAAAGARVSFEPAPSPSLKGKGTSRMLQLAAQRESALAAWLAPGERDPGAENIDVIGTLRLMRDEAMCESRFHDALDEAFAICGAGHVLSPI
ncbi:MAG TPA: hypothetical protein VGK58_16355, partial [Lacipirellulaceae bacterium]